MKAKRSLRKGLSIFLIIGVVTTIGFLSFTGMLFLTPSLLAAGLSFLFAVLVEGEVYKQNIMAGVKKLFTKDYLKKKIVEDTLKEYLENENNLTHSRFFRDYKAQLEYVKSLKENSDDKKILKIEKKRLRFMQQFFQDYVFSDLHQDPISAKLDQIIPPEILIQLQHKFLAQNTFKKVMGVFNILAGICCAFASFSSIHSGSLTLMSAVGVSLAPGLLMGGIVPLAILAGVGYAYLMFRNTFDLIENMKVQKLVQKFKQFLEQSSTIKKIGLISLAVVVVGLSIFATVATAGTWWYAVKQAARLLPYLSRFGNLIRNITVPAMSLPTLLFNLQNSFQTLQKIGKISLIRNMKKTVDNVINAYKEEPFFQFINPFRLLINIVEIPVKFVVFVMHLASGCVMSDRLGAIPPKITSAGNLGNELFVDAHYLMEDDHSDHHHHHGSIVSKLLTFVLSPVYLLSALWSFAGSSEQKSFREHVAASFGVKPRTASPCQAPEISNAWKRQEIIMKLDKGLKKIDARKANNEYAELVLLKTKLKNHISHNNQTNVKFLPIKTTVRNISQKFNSNDSNVANNHFSFFAKNSTEQMQKIKNDILNNDSYESILVYV